MGVNRSRAVEKSSELKQLLGVLPQDHFPILSRQVGQVQEILETLQLHSRSGSIGAEQDTVHSQGFP